MWVTNVEISVFLNHTENFYVKILNFYKNLRYIIF
jgi:hypothetical protein